MITELMQSAQRLLAGVARASAAGVAAAALIAGAPAPAWAQEDGGERELAGSEDARRAALESAARAAAEDLLEGLGTQTAAGGDAFDFVTTVYLVGLDADDADIGDTATRAVSRTVQRDGRLDFVDRSGAAELGDELRFRYEEIDFFTRPGASPSERERQLLQTRFQGADGVVLGRVVRVDMSDTELEARARIELTLVSLETMRRWDGVGEATIAVDLTNEAIRTGGQLLQNQTFWIVVGAVVVGVIVLVFVWAVVLLPMRRRLAEATKPREIIRDR